MARAGFGGHPHSLISSRTAIRSLLLASVLALAACEGSFNGFGATRATGTGPLGDTSPRMIERDTEAPEVFNLEEAGLWDGRPSLGGVWVAHPSVRDPERVIIRNSQTGQTVIGALFRRERENPGPRFQISSEAANALGILPGQPTTIRVTALRLQEIEVESEPGDTADAETDEAPEGDTAERPSGGTEPRITVAEADQTAPTADDEAPAGATPPERERRGLFALFGRRSSEPEAAEITETALPETPRAGEGAPAARPSETARATPGTRPQVSVEPRVTPPAGAAAAADPEPRERRGLRALFTRRAPEPEPEATGEALIPMPGAEEDAATAPRPAAPEQPFVQIGIFSVEANATAARARMRSAGLPSEIRRGRVEERSFWRVVVGPAESEAARAEMLRQVRSMGFDDAYTVRR